MGSFNFDPRSASLNTEMGVMFEDPGLAADVARMFTAARATSYAVSQTADGALRWTDVGTQTWRHDPETSVFKRALARVIGWLPIESQL